ncbi:hypothetical protein GCM10007874_46950 [Labrys miyagiensis]|uniref:Uncharacterized protein n=2 Tax=Labrys miyagiensis TaxID=346912 RepID=A0ABQ6CMW1_9HYPH|nr:hypothetical protein GCM10007874_46950 [Labrys miyagiensis]
MVWRVFEPDGNARELSGTYLSSTKKPSFAVKLGGDALVGGEDQLVALQPFSGSGQSGLGVPIRMGQITLERVK